MFSVFDDGFSIVFHCVAIITLQTLTHTHCDGSHQKWSRSCTRLFLCNLNDGVKQMKKQQMCVTSISNYVTAAAAVAVAPLQFNIIIL